MCREITTKFLGCGDDDDDHFVVDWYQCLRGREYELYIPQKEFCRGTRRNEVLVLRCCPACEQNHESAESLTQETTQSAIDSGTLIRSSSFLSVGHENESFNSDDISELTSSSSSSIYSFDTDDNRSATPTADQTNLKHDALEIVDESMGW